MHSVTSDGLCLAECARPRAQKRRGPVAFGQSELLERADVAAAEDGRTPLNTYGRRTEQAGRLCYQQTIFQTRSKPKAPSRQVRDDHDRVSAGY